LRNFDMLSQRRGENDSIFQKVLKFLEDMLETIRRAARDFASQQGSLEAQALSDEKSAQELRAVFEVMDSVLREANFSRSSQTIHKKFSLKKYSDQQKENWKSSNSIVLYETENQLRQFIEGAQRKTNLGKKIYFGIVPAHLAEFVEQKTGVNVSNFNVSLSSYEIIKVLKDHGDPHREALRGQRAITADDFVRIPYIIENADNIELSDQDYEGKPVLIFSKNENGKTVVVARVSNKKLDLALQTMYAHKEKENLATPTDVQAPVFTSKTASGTVLKTSIPDSSEKGNVKFSLKPASTVDAAALQKENEQLKKMLLLWLIDAGTAAAGRVAV